MYKLKQIFLSLCAVAWITCSITHANTTPTANTQAIKGMDRCQGKGCETIAKLAQALQVIQTQPTDHKTKKEQIKDYLLKNRVVDWERFHKSTLPSVTEAKTAKKNKIITSYYLEAFATELEKIRLTEYLTQTVDWDDSNLIEFKATYNKQDIIVQWSVNQKTSTINNIRRKGYDYSDGFKYKMERSNIWTGLTNVLSYSQYCQLKNQKELLKFFENFKASQPEPRLHRQLKQLYDCTFNIDRFEQSINRKINRGVIP